MNSSQFRIKYTTLALAEFVESCMLDKGKLVCAVQLDLSKVVDCVDRGILLDKWKYYGIGGKIYELLEANLTESKPFVSFGGHVSTWKNIDVRIPHFSFLGPLLLLIYINNLKDNTS